MEGPEGVTFVDGRREVRNLGAMQASRASPKNSSSKALLVLFFYCLL